MRPTRSDLQRFAQLCSLTPLESIFLVRAFLGQESEEAPQRERFQHMAKQALGSGHPAFLTDSLFYIRGRNDYITKLNGRRANEASQAHVLRGLFDPGRIPGSEAGRQLAILRWLRNFWFGAATHTGSAQYRKVLTELMAVPEFEGRWWDMALRRHDGEPAIDLPVLYRHPEHGTYRVFATRIVLPPVYHLREFVPTDERARDYIESLHRDGPAVVHTMSLSHWADSG